MLPDEKNDQGRCSVVSLEGWKCFEGGRPLPFPPTGPGRARGARESGRGLPATRRGSASLF